jgi:hypothetical protein
MTYNSGFDFNTADQGGGSFELIPEGTICHVAMSIRPGGVGDDGILTQSRSSDAQYLNCEFVVIEGAYDKRKFWVNLTVAGGQVDEQGQSKAGNITRATLRAILESSRNVRPDDESDEAKRKRLAQGYGDFNGIQFWAKVGVEPAKGEYKAKNTLGSVITPDKPGYGGASAAPAAQAAPAGAQPAWAGNSTAQQPATDEKSVVPAWAR